MKRLLLIFTLLFGSLFLIGATPNEVLIAEFSELPTTTSTMNTNIRNYEEDLTHGVGAVKLTFIEDKDYKLEIEYDGTTYIRNRVTVPATESRNHIIYGYYWTEEIDLVENKFIMIFEDGIASSMTHLQDLYDEADLQPFQIVTIWNLTTGEFYANKKLIVYGAIFENGGHYYLDVVIPVKSEDLISISVNYRYMRKYILGFTGKPVEQTYTIVKGDTFQEYTHLPTWTTYLLNPLFKRFVEKVVDLCRGEELTEDKISRQVYTIQQKDDFVTRFNTQIAEEIEYRRENNLPAPQFNRTSVEEVFNTGNDGGVYRVYLQEIEYWFQTGVQIRNMVITDIAYQFNGRIYQVNYHYIDSRIPDYNSPTDPFGDGIRDFIDKIKDALAKTKEWINANKWWLIGIGVIILGAVIIYFISPILRAYSSNKAIEIRSRSNSKKKKSNRKRKR